MKAKTLQIIWHSKDPVFSIDFHPDGYIATGGGDKDIKLWELCCDGDGNPQVRYASSLSGHSRTINCVRFSHSGHCLASAGDSGELLVWRPAPGSAPPPAPAPALAGLTTPVSGSNRDSHAASSLSRTPSQSLTAAASDERGGAGADGSGAAVGAWKLSATLRGHHDDVTDIAWAHDDAVVLSGSVENEVMMFDVETRRTLARLEGHRHYVQGVAWDPLGAWMVSQSADRTVRVHGLKPPPTGSKAAAAAAKEGGRSSTALARDVLHTHTLSKVGLQPPPTPPQEGAGPPAAGASGAAAEQSTAAEQQPQPQQQQQQQPGKPLQAALFHDESLNTFFRRLAWSPEGSLLAVPAGVYREHAGQQTQHATYLYARGHWGCPLLSLPCPSKASTAVRFCPTLFKLRQQQGGREAAGVNGQEAAAGTAAGAAGGVNMLGLPYRLVLAVATMDSVLLYDMQTCEPLMLVGPLHFAPITDIAWSRDGSCLAVASHDGYCSIVTFQPGELGDVIDESSLPDGVLAVLRKVQATAAATAVALTPRPASAAAAAAHAAKTSQGVTPQQQRQQQQLCGDQNGRSVPAAADMGVIGSGSKKPAAASGSPAAGAAAAPAGGAAATSAADGGGGGGGVPRPRRVTPQAVAADQVPAAPAVFGATAVAAAAPAAAGPAASAAGGGVPRPRRVTPQAVTTVGQGVTVPAAAGVSPIPHQQAVQEQQTAAKAQVTPAAPAGGRSTCGRVGLAAVQAALAAAAKKKRAAAAAQLAAGAGGGGAGAGDDDDDDDDDDVVIVGEVAGAAGGNKRAKLQ